MVSYDIAIVGAGIIGLAHAYIATRRGKKVVVIDRDAQANGASIRNFGFVTVTGQSEGDCWSMARRARDIWLEVTSAAKIPVLQRGMILAARHGHAETLIDAFLNTAMGSECSKLSATQAQEHIPFLNSDAAQLALFSPHEVRIESRLALPLLTAYLAEQLGVTFFWNRHVYNIDGTKIDTSGGMVEAEKIIICPGDNFTDLFADRLEQYGLRKCKLQMLRIAFNLQAPLRSTVLSELSLARSAGYAGLPGFKELQSQLDVEMPGQRKHDIHLIVAQSADGSLVVGDSHHYAVTPDPFGSNEVDQFMLSELDRVLELPDRIVTERWVGTYATATGRWRLTDKPSDNVRIVIVTSGCGASTCFAIAEETLNEL